MAEEKSKRYRMTKLQKYFIDNHLESDPKSLAIELGIPTDVIDRYMKRSLLILGWLSAI